MTLIELLFAGLWQPQDLFSGGSRMRLQKPIGIRDAHSLSLRLHCHHQPNFPDLPFLYDKISFSENAPVFKIGKRPISMSLKRPSKPQSIMYNKCKTRDAWRYHVWTWWAYNWIWLWGFLMCFLIAFIFGSALVSSPLSPSPPRSLINSLNWPSPQFMIRLNGVSMQIPDSCPRVSWAGLLTSNHAPWYQTFSTIILMG